MTQESIPFHPPILAAKLDEKTSLRSSRNLSPFYLRAACRASKFRDHFVCNAPIARLTLRSGRWPAGACPAVPLLCPLVTGMFLRFVQAIAPDHLGGQYSPELRPGPRNSSPLRIWLGFFDA